ncbi:hypothetical protein VPNG_02156 [Cytospora leucostoma]|uniref:F-box domain-containing protein n=1 Tax=Cytospora leucostoma TaxID=1230097 RepID=A0A423XHZ0_9PEZI|nr:hypothetical protein VPNG_02156 [Cytospora leucostoma]
MALNIVHRLSLTIEVFEEVLLHLTNHDLLHAQRVSRYWSDIIQKSPSLQQKLFFLPLSTSEASRADAEFNPLVKPIFPFLFDPQPFPGPRHVGKEDVEKATAHWADDPKRRAAILRPEASWRRMLPVQPAAPIDAVWNTEHCCGVDITLEYCELDTSHYNQTHGRTGPAIMACPELDLKTCATMGLLYDIVFHRLDDFAGPTIYVQWHMFPESILPKIPYWCEEEHFKDEACTVWDFDAAFSDSESHMELELKPTRPEDMRMRNEITVHSLFYIKDHYDRFPNPTGLKILDVPKGLIRDGEDAQCYSQGQDQYEYEVWGRLRRAMVMTDVEVNEAERDERLRRRSERDSNSGTASSEELPDSDFDSESSDGEYSRFRF